MVKKINKQYWEDYSFVMRGKQRKIVIKTMNRPMIVVEIKKKAKLSLSEISRALRGFVKQGLAECITPKAALGRVYQLTKRGELIKEKIKK